MISYGRIDVVRHVVLFRWNPEATAEDVSRIEEALGELPSKIPAIEAYRFGSDLGLGNGKADFATDASIRSTSP